MDQSPLAEHSLPSEAIVKGIAERTNTDPTELPPLYKKVDPEALDSLVSGEETCRVTFEYVSYAVTVAGPNQIEIHELPRDLPEDERPESVSTVASADSNERE